MTRIIAIIVTIAGALALTGCDGASHRASSGSASITVAETALTDNPGIAAALQNPVMTDSSLSDKSNDTAIRPPDRPRADTVPADRAAPGPEATIDTAQLMKAPPPVTSGTCHQCQVARNSLTLGALAAQQPDERAAGCAADLRYSASWTLHLPKGAPLFPDARVTEAAGTDKGVCALRVASFWTATPMKTVLDWYYTRAKNAGYNAEHRAIGQEHILSGMRKGDDSSYALFLKPRSGGGTEIDLVASGGS
ncbi:hypothetical protein GCM10023219_01100 [Stakelama sediminis]|uniref:Lipoprotein n=1 Tax=Stakelama sediminis TaxID=463200 RepID=A0A840Z138_9SPHN|nr:hypothetical protein [Stakelama sediminis]MBB5719454.1 hypothetical protein [Stakelama sediminis]